MAAEQEQLTLDQELALHRQSLDTLAELFRGKEDDELVLYRYLRGYQYDVEQAKAALQRTIAWRETFRYAEIRERARQLEQHQFPHVESVITYYPHGLFHKSAVNGFPVSIELGGQLSPERISQNLTLEQLTEYYVHYLESFYYRLNQMSREQNTLVRVVKICDLEGLGMRHINRGMFRYLKQIITTSQTYYPETLYKIIIINAPNVFNLAWRLVSPLLNARTLAKVSIFGKDYADEVGKWVRAEDLPRFLGGQCECESGCVPRFNEQAYFLPLAVGRNSKQEVAVPVEAGKYITWYFFTEKHDLGFSAKFVGQSGAQVAVTPLQKHAANVFRVSGEYKAEESGTLHMTFDNTHTYFYSKNVFYRTIVSEQSIIGQASFIAQNSVQEVPMSEEEMMLPEEKKEDN